MKARRILAGAGFLALAAAAVLWTAGLVTALPPSSLRLLLATAWLAGRRVRLRARGLVEALPGGIDHVFAGGFGAWAIGRSGWTLRSRDLAELIGEEVEISDHPGIVVDLVRRPRGPG